MTYAMTGNAGTYPPPQDSHFPLICAAARQAVGDARPWYSDRDDAYQEAVEAQLRHGEPDYAVARRAIDAMKFRLTRQRGGSQVTHLGLTPMDEERQSVTQRPPLDEDEQDARMDAALRALGALPEDLRLCVRLRYGLGIAVGGPWTSEQIARHLGVSISTVERRLAKARKAMAEALHS